MVSLSEAKILLFVGLRSACHSYFSLSLLHFIAIGGAARATYTAQCPLCQLNDPSSSYLTGEEALFTIFLPHNYKCVRSQTIGALFTGLPFLLSRRQWPRPARVRPLARVRRKPSSDPSSKWTCGRTARTRTSMAPATRMVSSECVLEKGKEEFEPGEEQCGESASLSRRRMKLTMLLPLSPLSLLPSPPLRPTEPRTPLEKFKPRNLMSPPD